MRKRLALENSGRTLKSQKIRYVLKSKIPEHGPEKADRANEGTTAFFEGRTKTR